MPGEQTRTYWALPLRFSLAALPGLIRRHRLTRRPGLAAAALIEDWPFPLPQMSRPLPSSITSATAAKTGSDHPAEVRRQPVAYSELPASKHSSPTQCCTEPHRTLTNHKFAAYVPVGAAQGWVRSPKGHARWLFQRLDRVAGTRTQFLKRLHGNHAKGDFICNAQWPE